MWPPLAGLRRARTLLPHGSGQPWPDPANDAMRKPRPRVPERQGSRALAAEPGLQRGPSSTHSPCQGRKAWQEPVGGLCQGPLSCEFSCLGLSSPTPAARGAEPGPQPSQLSAAWPTRRRRRRTGKGRGDPTPQPAGGPAQGAGDRRRRPQGDGWDTSQHPPVSPAGPSLAQHHRPWISSLEAAERPACSRVD